VLSKLTILALCLGCGVVFGQSPSDRVVILQDLGIRYTPPDRMTDNTTASARNARQHANEYRTKAAELLLDMSSGGSDQLPDWHQIWIFHLPRAQLQGLRDWMAEAKLNFALAGPGARPTDQQKGAVIDGHNFLVSEFDQKEPPITKHAKIYTTVCKTQLVSFVLVANSPEQMPTMEDSLKTLSFSGK
jgi:hypothetical protein